MKKSRFFTAGALVLMLAYGLILAGCGDNGGDIIVTFESVTANGSSTQTTTELTLTFSRAILDLSASDITYSGVSGVTRGTFSGSGPTYTLGIYGFTSGGTLSVQVAKYGYDISGSPQSTAIYYYNSVIIVEDIAVTFDSVTANGSATETTTQLELTFSDEITGLSASDITLSGVSGVSKGTLSGSGPVYTLPISGFTSGGTLNVAVAKSGYDISGSPQTAAIYYDISKIEYGWYGNGSSKSFTINNFTQLAEFAKIVKGQTGQDGPAQSDFKGKTVTLTVDIDMKDKTWNGIGDDFMEFHFPFNGTFDGGNKTISGLRTGEQGFFGLIGIDGIVKNLVFDDLSVNGNFCGGLTNINRGKVQNVSIINGSVSGKPGGVVHYNYGIVENCNFSGVILGEGGGIACNNIGVVRNCYVTGTINSTTSLGTGGIVGLNYENGTVQNCYATCSITGGTFIGDNIGGIAGVNNGTVENCYAAGNISGGYFVGGIAGDNRNGIIKNSVALNPSINARGNEYILGRISDNYSSGTHYFNNYSLDEMVIQRGWGDYYIVPNANGPDGANVSAEEAATQDWWKTAVNWNFTTIWEWDRDSNLPKLR